MAKKSIPDVDTDDIEMSAQDFPSASRRLDPTPSEASEAPPRDQSPPPATPSPPPFAGPPPGVATPQTRNAAVVYGAAVVACIAAIVSVASALYGPSGSEESVPANSPPALAAPAPAPPAVAPAPGGTTNQLLSLTMLDLSRALETARPYENEIRTIRAFGGDDAEVMAFIDTLEPYAATGVGTLDDIRAAMPTLSDDIRSAIEAGERSWTKRAATSLRSILTFWRPVEIPVDEAARATLEAAESQLAEGQIESAMAALGVLEGPARQAAAPLLEEMGRRLAVDRTSGALTELALSRLAGRD